MAQKRIRALQAIDYRLIALAAMASDLVDKPLAALYFYRRFGTAILFAHTLLAYLAVPVVTLWRAPRWWPYALAFAGHALVDRMWFFPDTFWWPFRGWRFHVWRNVEEGPRDIKRAYWRTFTRKRSLWVWELGGLVAGLWFVLSNRLYRLDRLRDFLRSGRVVD